MGDLKISSVVCSSSHFWLVLSPVKDSHFICEIFWGLY